MFVEQTKAQVLAEARRRRRAQERAERLRMLYVALVALALLAAFGAAGACDLADRTQGMGASMLPDPAWLAGEVG